jgi:N-acetylglucosaminyldiphosphoundecaprenol N-acetyl-beta-D-mannosaminyltransferase
MIESNAQLRRHVAGVPFDFISPQKVLKTIEHWRQSGRREYIEVNNPNAVVCCRQDWEMMRATLRAGLSLPDGVGVVLAALVLGYHRRHRVTGPALMLHLCDRGRQFGYRHYFYGGGPGVAQRLAERLTKRFDGLSVAGIYTPPFTSLSRWEDALVIQKINSARPDIVWVGLGCPKQEKWMLAHVDRIHAPAMIGVGAAFDFHSGAVKWAPKFIRRCGMEWLYRLLMEPTRMWSRNVRGLQFAALVMQQSLQHHLLGDAGALSPRIPAMQPLPNMDEAIDSVLIPLRAMENELVAMKLVA